MEELENKSQVVWDSYSEAVMEALDMWKTTSKTITIKNNAIATKISDEDTELETHALFGVSLEDRKIFAMKDPVDMRSYDVCVKHLPNGQFEVIKSRYSVIQNQIYNGLSDMFACEGAKKRLKEG